MKASAHDILGIHDNANEAQIKARYRELAKRYHPDRNHRDKTARWIFKEIHAAYEQIDNGREEDSTTPNPETRTTARSRETDQSGKHRQRKEEAARQARTATRAGVATGCLLVSAITFTLATEEIRRARPGQLLMTTTALFLAVLFLVNILRDIRNSPNREPS